MTRSGKAASRAQLAWQASRKRSASGACEVPSGTFERAVNAIARSNSTTGSPSRHARSNVRRSSETWLVIRTCQADRGSSAPQGRETASAVDGRDGRSRALRSAIVGAGSVGGAGRVDGPGGRAGRGGHGASDAGGRWRRRGRGRRCRSGAIDRRRRVPAGAHMPAPARCQQLRARSRQRIPEGPRPPVAVLVRCTHARLPVRGDAGVLLTADGTAPFDGAVPAREPEVENPRLDERGCLWAEALDMRIRLPAETGSGRAFGC